MRRAAASLPRQGSMLFREHVGYFQYHPVGFALLEEATVFRDALIRKPPLPAGEDEGGAPHSWGGPAVP